MEKDGFIQSFMHHPEAIEAGLRFLGESKVTAIGGEPAGSLFCYFLLEMATRVDLDIWLDICELRDFSQPVPHGSNIWGGIIHPKGDNGDCVFVIQGGQVEILIVQGGKDVWLMVWREEKIFGKQVIFEKESYSSSVRAIGTARLLTVDNKNSIRRVHQNPSLVDRMVKMLACRNHEMSKDVVRLFF